MATKVVKCDYCKKEFKRLLSRYNEAIKLGWKQFCSVKCQSRSKSKKVNKNCYNPLCNKSVLSSTVTGHAYCSRRCSVIYNNVLRSKPFVLVVCAYDKCYKFLKNRESKFCSVRCASKSQKGNSSYSRQKLLDVICDFYRRNNRIPTKADLGYLNRPARNIFGTWNKLIKAAGYDPNPVLFSKKFIANDGHVCDSLSEKIVDDWLSSREITHKVHIKYPWNNQMSTDFKVGEYWIELFGLTGQLEGYDHLMKQKLELIRQYKLKLICLYLTDIFPNSNLDKKLHILQSQTSH